MSDVDILLYMPLWLLGGSLSVLVGVVIWILMRWSWDTYRAPKLQNRLFTMKERCLKLERRMEWTRQTTKVPDDAEYRRQHRALQGINKEATTWKPGWPT